jgi:DNA-binding NarL/FixJ family response regulator
MEADLIMHTLVVDDDVRLRRFVRRFLAAEPDIVVIGEAENAQEGIRQAKELKPDLVLMDVRMPGINGIDATRRLKIQVPGLKVIVVTELDLAEYKQAAVDSGADGYVIKRFLLDDLLPAIRKLIGSGSGNNG